MGLEKESQKISKIDSNPIFRGLWRPPLSRCCCCCPLITYLLRTYSPTNSTLTYSSAVSSNFSSFLNIKTNVCLSFFILFTFPPGWGLVVVEADDSTRIPIVNGGHRSLEAGCIQSPNCTHEAAAGGLQSLAFFVMVTHRLVFFSRAQLSSIASLCRVSTPQTPPYSNQEIKRHMTARLSGQTTTTELTKIYRRPWPWFKLHLLLRSLGPHKCYIRCMTRGQGRHSWKGAEGAQSSTKFGTRMPKVWIK